MSRHLCRGGSPALSCFPVSFPGPPREPSRRGRAVGTRRPPVLTTDNKGRKGLEPKARRRRLPLPALPWRPCPRHPDPLACPKCQASLMLVVLAPWELWPLPGLGRSRPLRCYLPTDRLPAFFCRGRHLLPKGHSLRRPLQPALFTPVSGAPAAVLSKPRVRERGGNIWLPSVFQGRGHPSLPGPWPPGWSRAPGPREELALCPSRRPRSPQVTVSSRPLT